MSFIFDHQALPPTLPASPPVPQVSARLRARIWAGMFALLLLAAVVGSALLF